MAKSGEIGVRDLVGKLVKYYRLILVECGKLPKDSR